jgi:hypothetical protein
MMRSLGSAASIIFGGNIFGRTTATLSVVSGAVAVNSRNSIKILEIFGVMILGVVESP